MRDTIGYHERVEVKTSAAERVRSPGAAGRDVRVAGMRDEKCSPGVIVPLADGAGSARTRAWPFWGVRARRSSRTAQELRIRQQGCRARAPRIVDELLGSGESLSTYPVMAAAKAAPP
jgi:hypothetical protein